MIMHKQPTKPWTRHDFLLLEAYHLMEAERCQQCGLPRYICHSEDFDLGFRIESDTCNAKVQLDKHEEQREKKNKKDEKGTTYRPVPYLRGDGSRDLSDLRRPYYEAEAKRRKEIEETYQGVS